MSILNGNTVTVACKEDYFCAPIQKFRLTISGLDFCDMEKSNDSQGFLINKLYGKFVTIRSVKATKNDGFVAEVFFDKENVATQYFNELRAKIIN
jgi:hypothetical protein